MASMTLKECWGNGLRPKSDMGRDERYCRVFQNMLPLGPRGARKLRNPTYPLSSPSQSVTWPFPQILRDEKSVLYFGSATTVSNVPYDSSYPWTASALSIYSGEELVVNGRFDTDTDWTKGSGWSITGGVASATTASSDLAQAAILTNGVTYRISYLITARSAGTLTPKFGSTAGTTRNAAGLYTEEVTSNGTDFSFTGSGFTGTVDVVSIRPVATLSGTEQWRLASFQQSWFASNGTDLIYRIPGNMNNGTTPYVHHAKNLTVAAVGKHNNSLVLGGMGGSRVAATAMTNLFAHWKSVQKQNVTLSKFDSLDSEYILYSEPGGAENDIPFQVFMAAIGLPGSYEEGFFQGIAYSRVEDGLIGFYRCKECGPIRHLQQLGGNLVAYGKNGISLLTRTEVGYDEQLISNTGIPSRTVVAGDEQEHMFVNNKKELMKLTAKGLERLDYNEYIGAMTQTSIIATFDPIRRYYYFCDNTDGYCYTGFGLGQCLNIRPLSLLRLADDDDLLGTFGTTSNTEAILVGPIVSLPNNQTFEISSMDVTAIEADSTSWTATADWRVRQSDQFRRPTAVDVTDRGRTWVKKTGKDFRPYLKAAVYTDVDLDSVNLEINAGKASLDNILSASDTILNETNI
jgi:hypothetical protein